MLPKVSSFFGHDGGVSKIRQRTIAAGLFGLSSVIALVMPGSFVVETQGPAINVKGEYEGHTIMSISGVHTHPSDTTFFMTTVASRGGADLGVTGAEAFLAVFSKEAQSVPVRLLYSRQESADSVAERNKQAMANSQDAAAILAAQKAGYQVTSTVVVSSVPETSPSYSMLREEDVITSITFNGNTTAITSYADLSAILSTIAPGTSIEVGYKRPVPEDSSEQGSVTSPSPESSSGMKHYEEGTATVTTAAHEKDASGWTREGSLLGIGVRTEDVHNPVTVKYAVEGIGGPSAGMMFSLAIYDELTQGSLGGKEKIAGTGTISESGIVGPIGGIPHKLQGASAQGAKYFLAPASNCLETIGYEPEGMQIFAVHTFDDAVAAVQAIAAGDVSGLQTCQQVVESNTKN